MPRFHLFWTGIFGGTFVFRNVQFTNLQQKPPPEAIKTGVVSPRGEAFQNKTPPGHRHVPQSSISQPQTACNLGTWQTLKETSRVRCTPQLILIKKSPSFSICWEQKAFNTVFDWPRLGVFNQATLKVASSKGHWTPPKWCPWSKKAKTYQKNVETAKLPNWTSLVLLLMGKNQQLTSWYGKYTIISMGFIHPKWLFGISSIDSMTMSYLKNIDGMPGDPCILCRCSRRTARDTRLYGKLCDTWWKLCDKSTFRIFSRRIVQMYFWGFAASNADL